MGKLILKRKQDEWWDFLEAYTGLGKLNAELEQRIEDLPGGWQGRRKTAKMLRYQRYSAEDPPDRAMRDRFARLWRDREEFLQPHEIRIVEAALQEDPSERNVLAHCEWLAHMRHLRSDDGHRQGGPP